MARSKPTPLPNGSTIPSTASIHEAAGYKIWCYGGITTETIAKYVDQISASSNWPESEVQALNQFYSAYQDQIWAMIWAPRKSPMRLDYAEKLEVFEWRMRGEEADFLQRKWKNSQAYKDWRKETAGGKKKRFGAAAAKSASKNPAVAVAPAAAAPKTTATTESSNDRVAGSTQEDEVAAIAAGKVVLERGSRKRKAPQSLEEDVAAVGRETPQPASKMRKAAAQATNAAADETDAAKPSNESQGKTPASGSAPAAADPQPPAPASQPAGSAGTFKKIKLKLRSRRQRA